MSSFFLYGLFCHKPLGYILKIFQWMLMSRNCPFCVVSQDWNTITECNYNINRLSILIYITRQDWIKFAFLQLFERYRLRCIKLFFDLSPGAFFSISKLSIPFKSINRKCLKNHQGNEKMCLSWKKCSNIKYDLKKSGHIPSMTMQFLISSKVPSKFIV